MEVIGQVAAAEELGLSALAFGAGEAIAEVEGVQGGNEGGCSVPNGEVCPTGVEYLSVIVEGCAPAIESGGVFIEEAFEFERAGIEAPEAAAVELDDAGGSLDIGPDVVTLGEPEMTVRTPADRIDVLVGIASAEAAHEHSLFIGAAIAVGIAQIDEARAFADENAIGAELQAHRHFQTFGKAIGAVGAAVAIGVLQNEDEVVGFLAGLELGVGGSADDPKAATFVPAHLDGAHHPVGFAGEEINGKTVAQFEMGLLFLG